MRSLNINSQITRRWQTSDHSRIIRGRREKSRQEILYRRLEWVTTANSGVPPVIRIQRKGKEWDNRRPGKRMAAKGQQRREMKERAELDANEWTEVHSCWCRLKSCRREREREKEREEEKEKKRERASETESERRTLETSRMGPGWWPILPFQSTGTLYHAQA
jgi:hypothetical protein